MVLGSMEPSGAFKRRGDLTPECLGLVGCARELVPFRFGAPRDPPVHRLWSPPQAFSTPTNSQEMGSPSGSGGSVQC